MRDSLVGGGSRNVWLVIGLVAGLAIAKFWPHEPAYAVAVDRDAKFAITTCSVGVVGIDPIEAVFVLDFLTGQLKGAVLSRSNRQFFTYYYRNLAADFGVDPKKEPHYAIVNGQGQLLSSGGATLASSVIYVAELTTGKVICYAFPYNETQVRRPPVEMMIVDQFPFRAPS